MAHTSNNKLWGSGVDNIVSKKDKRKDLNFSQLNFEIYDTDKKDEKITTDFEPINNEDVINKAYLDEKLFKINGHLQI